MIELNPREMKSLSRILTVFLCCIPAFSAVSAPVATTAGNNLTAYHPNTANNNQWATMTNGRYDSKGTTTAKVDFGNCNAVVLRCAQPKCGKGGCTDGEVAAKIVDGCVKSNEVCKKYGDDLVNFMTAQLVASSNSKLREQELAVEQARAQAEAQAAAANAQSEQLSQMQDQMAQMQQQMMQQQQQSAQQLQEALAQQQAQSQQALDEMKTAATDAAKQTEAGVSAYQQEAINRGVSEETLMRQTITGQIMTKVQDAETSIKKMKEVLQTSFKYAGCDTRGNNCSGPKRIKKWRELAVEFLEPYDEAVDNIYDALMTAQMVGVDLSQIYMMLNDSCNAWGQYMCPSGTVVYPESDNTTEMPQVCSPEASDEYHECAYKCRQDNEIKQYFSAVPQYNESKLKTCLSDCRKLYRGCRKCRLLKVLTDGAEVYEGWINAEETSDDQRMIISCASGVLDSTKLFTRRTHLKKGAGLIDIDKMDIWLNQVEPDKKWKEKSSDEKYQEPNQYCAASKNEPTKKTDLQKAVLSKVVNEKNLCVDKPDEERYNADCPFVSQTYAICDTHQYNFGLPANSEHELDSEEKSGIKEIIGLKTTVISQQMYKQYEYLNATMRRLKTQLEKSVLLANLEAAGAKKEDGAGSASGSSSDDRRVKLPGAENCYNSTTPKTRLACLQQNINLIRSNLDTNKTNARKQLVETVKVANLVGFNETKLGKDDVGVKRCQDNKFNNKPGMQECLDALNVWVSQQLYDMEQDESRSKIYFTK